jgi:hypothetical protein
MKAPRIVFLVLITLAACSYEARIPRGTIIAAGVSDGIVSPLASPRVILLTPAGELQAHEMPIRSGSTSAMFYVKGRRILEFGTGRVKGAFPCKRGAGVVSGIAVSPSGHQIACIDSDDGAGPILLSTVGSNAVAHRIGHGLYMNVGPNVLDFQNEGTLVALVLDKACSGAPGYQNYPLRAVKIDIWGGSESDLGCSGSVVLVNSHVIFTRHDPYSGWSYQWRDGNWRQGELEGALEGRPIYVDTRGCLHFGEGFGCIVSGVGAVNIFQ